MRRSLSFLALSALVIFAGACQPTAPAAQPKSEAVAPTAAPAAKATDAPKAAAPTADGKTLRFGVLPITDVLPVYVAEQKATSRTPASTFSSSRSPALPSVIRLCRAARPMVF